MEAFTVLHFVQAPSPFTPDVALWYNVRAGQDERAIGNRSVI